MTATRITANDFFLGLFSALKLRGEEKFSIREDRFDAAIKAIYDELSRRSDEENLELRFRVRLRLMQRQAGPTVRF